jgi:hypothetical protein
MAWDSDFVHNFDEVTLNVFDLARSVPFRAALVLPQLTTKYLPLTNSPDIPDQIPPIFPS